MNSLTCQTWNAQLYDRRHAFVYQRAADLIEVLAPQPHERILDVGCGTGHLAVQISQHCAQVVALDASPQMIEAARGKYLQAAPKVQWQRADARDFDVGADFDAVFSNAALHWITPPEAAIGCIHRALKSGGRLVCEFGGRGNIAQVLASIEHGLQNIGRTDLKPHSNYFPSISQYTSLLEAAGLETVFATLFHRPTPLQGENALRDWVRQFRAPLIEALDQAQREEFQNAMEEFARPILRDENGWFADYRRLRIVARKVA